MKECLEVLFTDPLIRDVEQSLLDQGIKNREVIINIYCKSQIRKYKSEILDELLRNLQKIPIAAITIFLENFLVPIIYFAVKNEYTEFSGLEREK